MSDIKFFCPACRQRVVCDAEYGGRSSTCPTCQGEIIIPLTVAIIPAAVPYLASVTQRPPLPPVIAHASPLPSFTAFPCPNCRGADIRRVGFTLWGGWLGPRMFNHVECAQCGTTYNGKTGSSNATAIAIYVAVTAVI